MSTDIASTGKSDSVLRVKGLEKTFRIGFLRKKVPAVCGIDFEVRRGEVFGLLGPNGAGKTSTIKMVLRLIFQDRGSIALFDQDDPGRAVMARVGYMPENPYIYQYLRPMEFLDLCGRLAGMDGPSRRKRSAELVERVGLGHATDRPIGKFSKGMMQRIGIAQALLHDPELLVLDEPMSGLDPIGRKEVRDLVLEQRAEGKTILFTSHILSDVEMLCDRVGIMQRGKMSHYGALDALLSAETRRVEVELDSVGPDLESALEGLGATLEPAHGHLRVVVEGDAQPVMKAAIEHGAQILSVTPGRETLEGVFVRDALQERQDTTAAEGDA
ncbi:MAG: ABC transporter ATP-binding protein [Sandaracinaceae bacterium]